MERFSKFKKKPFSQRFDLLLLSNSQMNLASTIQFIPIQTDIYLLDQIMKGRYIKGQKILDAGCGGGRNLQWFIQEGFDCYGIDRNTAAIDSLRNDYPSIASKNLIACPVEKMQFTDEYFDHIISSAVLHFAKNTQHFKAMIGEMVRILKKGGSLFIRMTSDIGIEQTVKLIEDGVYEIPDGSVRFLLTRQMVNELLQTHSLSFLEPLKTVNVDDVRCMSTLMLMKN